MSSVISSKLLEILVCPRCREKVDPEGGSLRCSSCRLLYPIADGVPVMLVEEATKY